ncbi:DUF2851 family protein [Segetibacter koreensis]|uniref:DUF2851 family protein n=1 Tax=Segetibacter koreensis TaxID=398037 RepID=UPI00036560A6|nr:DUF2851 family protein [Segetibacter koreensis]
MNERLLQFIWQFQYFNKKELQTDRGESLTIVHTGHYNTHQGPDFLDAKIIINNTTWAGNIEIHHKSSDWNKHNHTADKNYSNVILHVVWENDADIYFENGSVLPILSLQNLVPKLLLDRFKELMLHKSFVPCDSYLPVFSEMKWLAWKERMSIERLQRKSSQILSLLADANQHWEEVFWWLLSRNFGIKVNADIFETVARSIPVNILAKHKNQIHQLEGFLLGQAGLLNEDFDEDYPKLLKKEYLFYQKKYQLKPVPVKPFFLRMRPASFPTIRLAQLAMLIYKSSHLFSKIKETDNATEVKELLNVTANDYWHYHYTIGEASEYHPKQLGMQMTENIIINTAIPVLFAYGSYKQDEAMKDKALRWLSELSAEKNTITKKWTAYGVSNDNALESQALIELKNNYCDLRRCLECAVGNAILKERETKSF